MASPAKLSNCYSTVHETECKSSPSSRFIDFGKN